MTNLCDLAAEGAVLAGIYKYGADAYYDVVEFLQIDTFTDEVNQALFKCFSSLIEKDSIVKFDNASVLSKLEMLGYRWILDRDMSHVKSVFNRDILFENVRRWASRIRMLHIGRLLLVQVRDAGRRLEDISGDEAIENILGIVEKPIFDFSQLLYGNITKEPELISNDIDEYIKYLADNPVDMVGVDTGYSFYNKMIGGGLRRKTVSLIGARQGEGKSLIALNMGLNIASRLVPVLYLDTEMDAGDHRPRALSNLTFGMPVRVTIDEIETGQFGTLAAKIESIKGAATTFKDMPFYYMSVVGRNFEDAMSIMRRWLHKHVGFDNDGVTNECVIMYDYFKLMTSEKLNVNLAEFQALGFQMSSLHNFAYRYNVPILTFTQLNREGISETHGGVIRGSDRLLDLVTNFTIFRQKSVDELAKQRQDSDGNQLLGDCKLEVLKSRHGAGASEKSYVHMQKYGKYGKVIEVGQASRQNSGSN